MLTATVSGSFHRHLHAITAAVQELFDLGVKVLSPADPRIVDSLVVDSLGEFLFVASDRVRSVKLVQDRHIQGISASDFLWLVAPDGYVGQSASMELGFAVAWNSYTRYDSAIRSDATAIRKVRGEPWDSDPRVQARPAGAKTWPTSYRSTCVRRNRPRDTRSNRPIIWLHAHRARCCSRGFSILPTISSPTTSTGQCIE
jgi:hypothetical protein